MWRRAGILPVPQAVFLYNFGDFYPVYLGWYGEHGRWPSRSLLDEGWEFPVGSDITLGAEEKQTNPLSNIWCTVERNSFMGAVVQLEEAVSVSEALRMHTINAARAGCRRRTRLARSGEARGHR